LYKSDIRVSDYLVNEIAPDGNVVHLTALSAPPMAAVSVAGDVEMADFTRIEEMDHRLRELVGDDDAAKMKQYIETPMLWFKVTTDPIRSKAKRGEIHAFFERHLSRVFMVETDKDCIVITRHNGEVQRRNGIATSLLITLVTRQVAPDADWGSNTHCHFTMLADNIGTLTALDLMSTKLKYVECLVSLSKYRS